MNSYMELGNPNELYKLHTGHRVFDESGDSDTSLDEEGSEDSDIYRPPLYTLQELEANLVKYVPKPGNHSDQITQEAVKTPEQIVDELMESWLDSNYCYICHADLLNGNNAQSHYGSMRHAKKLHMWKEDELHKARRKLEEQAKKSAQPVIESPNPLVESLFKSLETSDFCYICEATLPNDHNAQSHYKSKRHKTNLNAFKEYELSKVKISAKNSVMERGANKEHAGNIHNEKQKRNSEIICRLCQLKFTELQKLLDHQATSPHCLTVRLKADLTTKGIAAEYWMTPENTCIVCLLCNSALINSLVVESHLTSDFHLSRYRKWIVKQSVTPQDSDRKWYYCNICELSLVGLSEVSYHEATITHINQLTRIGTEQQNGGNVNTDHNAVSVVTKTKRYKCFLCSVTFATMDELASHCETSPHKYLIYLKQSLVLMGIVRDTYWTSNSSSKILCTLCDLLLGNERTLVDHIMASEHRKNYTAWLQKQTKDFKGPNAKWFYCKTCKVTLDGTTNAENHYADVSHLRTQTTPTTGVIQGSHPRKKTEEVSNLSVNSSGASSSTTDVIETRDSNKLLQKKLSYGASSTYETTAYVAKNSHLRSQSATAYVSPTRVREPDHTARKPGTTVPIRTQTSYAVIFAPRTNEGKETLSDEVILAKLASFEEKLYWSKRISSNSAVELLTRYINELDSFEQRSGETMQQEICYTNSGTPTYVQLHTNGLSTVNRINANPAEDVTYHDYFDDPYEYYPTYDYFFDDRHNNRIKKYDYNEKNIKKRSFLKSIFVYGSYGMILFFVLKRFKII